VVDGDSPIGPNWCIEQDIMKSEQVTSTDRFIYHRLSEEDLRGYEERGYHHYGPILTDAGLETMREQCMKVWSAEKGEFDGTKNWLQNSLLQNIHHKSNIVRDYYFQGPLLDVTEQIIGPNIKAATSQLTFKMRGNTMDFGWHQDNSYGELDPYNAISCLTALDDADEENGCLRIIPGSNKQGQIDPSDSSTVDDKAAQVDINLEVDESKAIPVPMKAGECLFFNCHTLHQSRGNYSKTRDRRILFLRFADADAVEVYNDRKPRIGRLLRGKTVFPEVEAFEADL
jgi:ectoine hydroxylase-related dioxygenase (phytanoyl-CoA dioxygenase family)